MNIAYILNVEQSSKGETNEDPTSRFSFLSSLVFFFNNNKKTSSQENYHIEPLKALHFNGLIIISKDHQVAHMFQVLKNTLIEL